MQLFDPSDLTVGDIYALMTRAIVPRPIAWVSSCSADGHFNLAPFSYFNGLCSQPPAIMFSPVNWPDGREKDTTRNIQETGEFVINLVPRHLAQAMVDTSAEFAADVNEFDVAGLDWQPSERVKSPRVVGSPVQFECKLIQVVNVGAGPLAANVIIGEILLFHVDAAVLDERGRIDSGKLAAIGRLGGREYCAIDNPFELRPREIDRR